MSYNILCYAFINVILSQSNSSNQDYLKNVPFFLKSMLNMTNNLHVLEPQHPSSRQAGHSSM